MVRDEFTRKKIDSLTLGERMKKIRSERRLSLSEISKNTKVQGKYLEYLENGEYEKLPADVYVKGFLRNYAAYTGISEKALIKLYEREKGIQSSIKKTSAQDSAINPVGLSRFAVTPRFFTIFLIVLLMLAGFFYLYQEASSLIAHPRLIIIEPADGEIIEKENIDVRGITDMEAKVFINDQPVLVNDKGEFSENIELQEGLNVINIKARNKFDKEISKTVTIQAVIKTPEENSDASGEEAEQ